MTWVAVINSSPSQQIPIKGTLTSTKFVMVIQEIIYRRYLKECSGKLVIMQNNTAYHFIFEDSCLLGYEAIAN